MTTTTDAAPIVRKADELPAGAVKAVKAIVAKARSAATTGAKVRGEQCILIAEARAAGATYDEIALAAASEADGILTKTAVLNTATLGVLLASYSEPELSAPYANPVTGRSTFGGKPLTWRDFLASQIADGNLKVTAPDGKRRAFPGAEARAAEGNRKAVRTAVEGFIASAVTEAEAAKSGAVTGAKSGKSATVRTASTPLPTSFDAATVAEHLTSWLVAQSDLSASVVDVLTLVAADGRMATHGKAYTDAVRATVGVLTGK